jgi:chemotaxis signal transduction protein
VKEEMLALRTAVDCLLLPLSDRRLPLLVPLNAVAEVVDQPPALARAATGVPWLQGWLRWREREIPVLAHEGIARTEVDAPSGSLRVVIFNAIGAAAAHGFYGLAIRDLPRPLRLGSDSDLRAQEVVPPRGTAMVVEHGGEPAAIPDFELLEQLVVEAAALDH